MSGDLHLSGHTLAAAQIRKHGRDRYPTTAAQYAKVLDELGKLGEALMLRHAVHHVHADDGTVEGCPGCFCDAEEQQVRREYADTGLALFELGNKMGLDLIACMTEVVQADERKF